MKRKRIVARRVVDVDLQPGKVVTIPFPDLTDPLLALSTGKHIIPCMDIRLPDNYRVNKKFPLFIYIPGGYGGNKGDLSTAQKIMGTMDWILGSLPLFKKRLDTKEIYGGILVCFEDFPAISTSYATMLGRLFELIPNIDVKRSTIGGASNGAHTLGVLITGQDPTILGCFRNYYFNDGGMLQLADLHKRSLRSHRFLMLVGAKNRRTTKPRNLLDIYLIQSQMLQGWARINGLDFRRIVRPDMGHSFDTKCMVAVRRWAKQQL